MSDHGLEMDVQCGANAITVHLRGELDLVSARKFQTTMKRVVTGRPEATTVLLDASDLVFLDSVGIGQVIAAWKLTQADGHRLGIIKPHPFTRRLFEITGIDFLLVDPGLE